jgi:hypothetical protein
VKNLSITSNSLSVAILTSSVRTCVPGHTHIPQAAENVVTGCFAVPFWSQRCRTMLMTDSKFSLPDGSTDTNFSSLGLLWAEQLMFKVTEMIREVSDGFWRQKTPGKLFPHF